MQSKLTPELSQALDRAIDAAASDPLVEALEALQECADRMEAIQELHYYPLALPIIRARAVLAKYRPALSDSDTLKS